MSDPDSLRTSLGSLAAAGCLLALVALFAYAPIFAVDFFWLLKLGQLIAERHSIPEQDLFSAVHPERHYVQFQWLWEWLVYQAYALGGFRGVRWFQVATLVASFTCLGVSVWRVLRSRALTFAVCAFALVLFEDRFQTRPSATMLGFVALMLPWLVDDVRRARRWTWAWVAVLACAWSNIHGGESLLLVLCLGALATGAAIESRVRSSDAQRLSRELRLTAAALVGVCLSPAFFSGLQDWARAIGPQLASGNKEWRPSYTMLENGFTPSYVLIGLGPTLLAILYVTEQRRWLRQHRLQAAPWGEWLLCAGLLLLAQLTVRNAFLSLVPLCCMLARHRRMLTVRVTRLSCLLALLLLVVAFQDHVLQGYGGLAQARDTLHDDLAPQAFPEQLADFMHEAHIEGGILNDGRWGGYLIWRLWPECHVFVDTRHDLTPDMWPVFLQSHVPRSRPAAMDQAFARWGIELAVFRGPTFPVIVSPEHWQLLYKAGDQELYQHRSGQHAVRNAQRTRQWLESRVPRIVSEAEQSALAAELGADLWLSAPSQRRLQARAESLMRSGVHDEQEGGLFMEAELLFDAGRYAKAFSLLGRLVVRPSASALALYRYALTAYVVNEPSRARWALSQLAARVHELSPSQNGRLAVLAEALGTFPQRAAPLVP